MGKLVSIATFERFRSLWESDLVDDHSLNFILDTGQLYTHGVFINSAAFGTAANGAVSLTIAGTSNTLALSSHTHSNYYDNSHDIDIGNNKIISGNNDLLYCNQNALYLGNTSNPTYISGDGIYARRGQNSYTVLDTGNFEVTNTTNQGYTFSNTAIIKYGSSSFQIDYVKRLNTSQAFDYLHGYTQAGTNRLNGVQYGYISFVDDPTAFDPDWAQLRINIPNKTVQFRTSADANNWMDITVPTINQNALNVAGIVAAPTQLTVNKVWKTDDQGNPAWRDEISYTFSNLQFQQIENTNLMTYNSQATKTILAGDNIAFSYEDNVLTIRAQDTTYNNFTAATATTAGNAGLVPGPDTNKLGTSGYFLRADGSWEVPTDTWKAASTSQEGYVPRLQTGGGTITSTDVAYVLAYKSGVNNTTLPVWIQLPTNAYENTWIAWSGATSESDGTAGYMPKATSAQKDQFLRGDGQWVTLNDYQLTKATTTALGGIIISNALNTAVALTSGNGSTASRYYGVQVDKDGKAFVNIPWEVNTDGTGVKAGTVSGTKKTDGTLIKTDSSTGLVIEGGTNKFSIGDGSNYIEIAITPSITNNITGTGTNGKLVKWNGTNSITDGPALSSSISNQTQSTKFLREDGSWEAPSYTTLPTFYNLVFNNGTSDVLTYDPDGNASKKIVKGTNITFTVDGNNLTISATNTWTANAVGVAGYVAAPTKADNANMTWQTDADGNPAWRASNNHSHSYLPLSGGTITNGSNWAAINYRRTGGGYGTVGGLDGNGLYFYHKLEDESKSINMYLKAGDGLRVGGTLVSLDGHTHSYLSIGGGTLTGALIIKGVADTGQYSQGGFNKAYANIILQGDNTYGVSGIVFKSMKANDTSINTPSDVAFIQYHPYGVTASAYNTTPTEASSGELGRLVIGIGNDTGSNVGEELWLQTAGANDLKHYVVNTSYTIWDSGNLTNLNQLTNGPGYITSSGSCTSASYFTTYASDGNNNQECLQNFFSTCPKSVGTAVRLQKGSHSMAFGWFLKDYAYANAYGGWFISDYATPSWVGVSNGTWTSSTFLTTGNYSSYALPLSGGTMDGTNPIVFTTDKIAINFRTGHDSYNSKVQYMTAGNEALVFSNKNSVTSYIFKCGYTLENGSNWSTIFTSSDANNPNVPTIQLKNQSLYVNEFIPNATTPSYNFYVNGSSKFNGDILVTKYLQFSAYPGYGSGTCQIYYNQTNNLLRTNTVGNINLAGNLVWHQGNDGSGSGLDADLLDGTHASSFVLHRESGASYNNLAHKYTGSTNPVYFRVAMPTTAATWCMIQMTFSLIYRYNSGMSAKIIVYGNWSSGSDWNGLNANVYGWTDNAIKVYASDKKYIYIYTNTAWETLSLDKVICSDNITGYDISAFTIDYVSSLPATHQDADMYYEINTGNYSSYALPLSGGQLSGKVTSYVLDDIVMKLTRQVPGTAQGTCKDVAEFYHTIQNNSVADYNIGLGSRIKVGQGPDKCGIIQWISTEGWANKGRLGLINRQSGGSEVEALSILPGGNVGIGITNPTYAFQVKNASCFNGVITSTYKSGRWVTSLTSSAITLTDSSSSYGGWICGPTKDGRITISTYQASDNYLYFGYGERGRTDNSFAEQMRWEGPSNKLIVGIVRCDGYESTQDAGIVLDSYGNVKFKGSGTHYHIDNSSGTKLFAFWQNGKVGIGTAGTEPSYKLHVVGDIGCYNVIPISHNTYHLGTEANSWQYIYTKAIRFGSNTSDDWSENGWSHPWYGIDLHDTTSSDSTEKKAAAMGISSYNGITLRTGNTRLALYGASSLVKINGQVDMYLGSANSNTGAASFYFSNSYAGPAICLDPTSNSGIGTSNDYMRIVQGTTHAYITYASGKNLYVFPNGASNQGYFNSSGNWNNASDMSLKRNINKPNNVMLHNIWNWFITEGFKTFIWKSTNKSDFGVIAQEVLQILPEVTDYDKHSNLYGVDYIKLHSFVLASVINELKEAKATIEILKSQVEELQELIEEKQD